MLIYDELLDLIDATKNSQTRQIANYLRMALNDWPKTNLCEPYELVQELNQTIVRSLTFDNLRSYMDRLSTINDAWKIEALTSIMAMFDTKESRENDDLEEIINRLSSVED